MIMFSPSSELRAALEVTDHALAASCAEFLSDLYERSVSDQPPPRGRWIPISTKAAKSVYGDRTWRRVRETLTELGILETNHSYKVGRRPKTYRIAKAYIDKFEAISTDQWLGSARAPKSILSPSIDPTTASPQVAWIMESYNCVSISGRVEDLLDQLSDESPIERHRAAIMLQRVASGTGRFSRPECGRLFYPITGLRKAFRRALLIDGKPTCEIDVAGSQPLLHATLYSEQCEERARYVELAGSPSFYETVAGWVGFRGDRSGFKKLVFSNLFYGHIRQSAKRNLFAKFREQFPKLAAKIELMKRDNLRDLPLLMQQTEAKIVIDYACDKLRRQNVKVLTVHDSIIVAVTDRPLAERALRESWQEVVQLTPSIRTTFSDPNVPSVAA